jgi:nucleotide-binding universal stress UspA family protein
LLTIKTILAPIDFTETSTHALDYAVDFAAVLGAAVSVVHVYQVPIYSFPDAVVVAPPALAADLSAAAQKALDAAVSSRQRRCPAISGTLVTGNTWEEICRLATEQNADMIVMGTHGRRGIPRALLGSIAEKVIRTSTVPVLTVHGPRNAS